jgi:hypothetical protein
VLTRRLVARHHHKKLLHDAAAKTEKDGFIRQV